ncbi:MAG: transcription elongation factor GreA [Patescibacteria group bacterium]|nr:transcription elongation factor GreA [Patescibacteria group bacterium]
MSEISYITEEKKQALIEELDYLRNTKRKEVLESLKAAKALGDLSENAEYHQAREDQGKLEDRINKVKYMLQNAVVAKKKNSDSVRIGNSVVLKKDGHKDLITYSIVGAEEADMTQKKISNSSPLGEALFGRKKGESITLKTPKGSSQYTIVKIQ